MSCSRSSLNRALALAVLAAGCVAGRPRPPPVSGPIAVLPPINLAGVPVPLRELRADWETTLAARGIPLVPREDVEAFLARRRLRWTGGIAGGAAQAAAEELNASAVLITAVTLYQPSVPPRIGLSARLVSAGESPGILWMDERARAGDQSPGLFDLGLVEDVKRLGSRVAGDLAGSLASYLGGIAPPAARCGNGFSPQSAWRTLLLDGSATVAVLPFANDTARRNAGDLVALQFVRQLLAGGALRPVEPGVLRDQLLQFPVPTGDGVSLDAARVIADLLKADYVLAGTVREYAEPSSSEGAPAVQFTAALLDGKTSEVVWQSSSFHRGDEGVFFFDLGRVITASELSCRMAASALDGVGQRANRTAPTQTLRTAARH